MPKSITDPTKIEGEIIKDFSFFVILNCTEKFKRHENYTLNGWFAWFR